MLSKRFSSNFYHLILGRSSRNIADSFYFIALSVGLINVYAIEAGQLSLFTLLGLLPNMLAFLYGAPLNRIKNDKRWLVIFQVIQLLIILCMIVGLSQKIDVRVMYGLNVCFSLSTNLLNTLQMKIVPETLNNDEQVINKSIDIQYFTSNVLDIISNFIASILLGLLSYFALFQLSVPFFVAAIYLMLTIKLPKGQDKGKADTDLSEEAEPGKRHLFETFSAFKESRFASFIIMTESILSGGTDLLLTLAPIYLISEGISIKYIGLVLAVHKFSDLVGALLVPQVKLSYRNFFFLDYIVSGILLVLVFLIPVPLIKLILFALDFIIIGISGNMFEKMIYAEYDYSKIGLIYSTNSSLYALFAVIFLIIPQFYTNIKMLGIVINVLTCIVGIYLLVKSFPKKGSQEKELATKNKKNG